MFPPPGISLGDPEGVESRVFTGLRHGKGFTHRLHAELQNTDVEWDWHKSAASSKLSVRILPRVFQPFNQFPQRFVQRSWNTCLFAPVHNRSIHKVDLGLPLGKYVLQHAGTVLAGRVGALLHELPGVAVQFDSQGLRDRHTYREAVVKK